MECFRDETVMLGLLSEIIAKSDNVNIVKLDLGDENRNFNFDLLKNEGRYFSYFTQSSFQGSDGRDDGIPYYSSRTVRIGIKGLTVEGHRLFSQLKNKLEAEHREIEAVAIASESNIIAERSNEIAVKSARWAYLAVIIATLTLLWQILNYFHIL